MASRVSKIQTLTAALIALVLLASSCVIGVVTASADEQPAPNPSSSMLQDTASAPPSLNGDNQTSTGTTGTSTSKPASKHKVEFDAAATGISNPPTQLVTLNNKAVKPSVDPSRTGYRFAGWFNRDVEFDFDTPVATDLTLTAHWIKQTGSWSFSPDLGTTRGATKVTLVPPTSFGFTQVSAGQTQSLAIGSDGNAYTLTDKAAPAKVSAPAGAPEDFRFTQVSAGQTQSLAIGSDGNAYTHSALVTAANKRKTNLKPVSIPAGLPSSADETLTSVKFDGVDSLQPPQQQKDGTWTVSTPAHTKGTVDVTVTHTHDGSSIEEHKSYTYQAKSYSVTFDKADGSSKSRFTVKVDEDDLIARPVDPTRDGWLFDGWFTESSVAFDFGRQVTSDLTLTAHWSEVASTKSPLISTRVDSACVPSTSDGQWKMNSPCRGPEFGGNVVTLTPPKNRGVAFDRVSPSDNFTAATNSLTKLYTWGSNSQGQLANGGVGGGNVSMPTEVKSAGLQFRGVTTGHNFGIVQGYPNDDAAANTSNGTLDLYAWGINDHGQLGDGTTTSSSTLVKVKKPAGLPDFRFLHVRAGYNFVVALCSYGTSKDTANRTYVLYSWGGNEFGQLGIGSTVDQSSPVKVNDFPYSWQVTNNTKFAVGDYHVVSTASDLGVYSWGKNDSGQLGDGTRVNRSTPDRYKRPDNNGQLPMVVALSAGSAFSVAVLRDGNAYSWGSNQHGALGIGNAALYKTDPQLVQKSPDVVSYNTKPSGADNLASGYEHTFIQWKGKDNQFHYSAFGSNVDGQLGLGNTLDQYSPVPVPDRLGKPANVEKFAYAGGNSSFGRFMNFGPYLYGWGRNDSNQLGIQKEPASSVRETKPKQTLYPRAGVLKSVSFDKSLGTDLKLNDDDTTWSVTVPEHDKGEVVVKVEWSLWGVDESPQDHLRYTYVRNMVLPNAGGSGVVILFLVLGLLTMAGSLVVRNHRRSSTRLQHSSRSR